jgi:protein SCO1
MHLKFRSATTLRRQLSGCCLIALTAAFSFSACSRNSSSSAIPQNVTTYEVHGRIVSITPHHEAVTVAHEEVPGFMPAMTMPFAVKEPRLLSGYKTGDNIQFRLVVTQSDSWIDQVNKDTSPNVNVPVNTEISTTELSTKTSNRLKEGDRIPEFSLVNQDGKTITRDSFLGRPFVLTFIFTRCPLPNYCPLMMSHFNRLQNQVSTSEGSAAQLKLLSISFDPEHDSPAVFKDYAASHGADLKVWTLACGERAEIEKLTTTFSVYTKGEGGTISHGLCTALVDANGVIKTIWRGNGWSPDDVFKALAQQPD